MNTLPALPAFVAALTALLLKATLLSTIQVVARTRSREFTTPEDARLFGLAPAVRESSFVVRCGNVWRNDVENIPWFLAAALAFTLLGGDARSAAWLFGSYAAIRFLHTAVYLRGLQPWRAIAYLTSLAVLWTIVIKSLALIA
ncbi:MAG: MAPEG family protein [bacterium]|nr:MAPEG family protein [bacterium]